MKHTAAVEGQVIDGKERMFLYCPECKYLTAPEEPSPEKWAELDKLAKWHNDISPLFYATP